MGSRYATTFCLGRNKRKNLNIGVQVCYIKGPSAAARAATTLDRGSTLTGKSLSHNLSSHIIAHQSASSPKKPTPEKKTSHQSSQQRVDDLLRAFSDQAYSVEEEDLPWESWNYTRISVF
jgi:hypothetical protein